jgi:hypothetical protein
LIRPRPFRAECGRDSVANAPECAEQALLSARRQRRPALLQLKAAARSTQARLEFLPLGGELDLPSAGVSKIAAQHAQRMITRRVSAPAPSQLPRDLARAQAQCSVALHQPIERRTRAEQHRLVVVRFARGMGRENLGLDRGQRQRLIYTAWACCLDRERGGE